MPIRPEREYRAMSRMNVRANENDGPSYIVEGYASTFESYLLYDDGVCRVNERIERTAFDDADMSDVIFLYNHEGKVYARQKNGTLELSVDDHGLKVTADLSSTDDSRRMFEDIRTGLIDQMSFAFTVADERYERDTHTRVINRIGKVYDVSAVSIPANPATAISARTKEVIDGVIEAERAERLEMEERERLNAELDLILALGGANR